MLHVYCTSSTKLPIVQVFVELEIPHIYHSVARNSPKRQELVDKWDVFQVPYIEVGFLAVARITFYQLVAENGLVVAVFGSIFADVVKFS